MGFLPVNFQVCPRRYNPAMRWSSAVSDDPSLDKALAACTEIVTSGLEGTRPDLAVVFVSPHFATDYKRVPELIRERFGVEQVVGCSAGGVIGGGHEVEHRPGFSLTVASLPGVDVDPIHVDDARIPDPDAGPEKWEETLGVARDKDPHFVLLADPFSIRMEEVLNGLDYAFPQAAKIGGMASGGERPGMNALYMGQEVHRGGLVGVALSGNIIVETIVAQGCRPIGQAMQITKCEGNLLQEVDGRPPLQVLQELYERAPERDKGLFQQSLFLGIVMDELQENYRLGDFLIRNLFGIDRESGGFLVGAHLREHQTVQFHLRDAQTASDDLRAMLAQYLTDADPTAAQGALLFSCLGRGSYLYGHADHDTGLFSEHLGPVPLGGFFCNGEIGQVGAATYLHGYTSSFGIFRPRDPE